jgi:hypothetical protein
VDALRLVSRDFWRFSFTDLIFHAPLFIVKTDDAKAKQISRVQNNCKNTYCGCPENKDIVLFSMCCLFKGFIKTIAKNTTTKRMVDAEQVSLN